MDQIQDYTDNYIPKLEVKGGPRHLKDDSLVQNFNSVDDLLGKNSRSCLNCFHKKENNVGNKEDGASFTMLT
jgi:hypothetical protein